MVSMEVLDTKVVVMESSAVTAGFTRCKDLFRWWCFWWWCLLCLVWFPCWAFASLHALVPSLTGAWRTAVPRAKKRLQFSSLVGTSVRWELETCHAASYTTFALLGAFSRWGLGRVSSVPWMAGRAYNGLGTGWGNLTLGRLCAKLSRWNLVLVMMIS